MISPQKLFKELYFAKNEQEVDKVIGNHSSIFNNSHNWKPLGGHENNFGVIENQQASPIAALIEKITNSIDATLMKRAYQLNINPKSQEAPQSISKAITTFFPQSSNWDIHTERKKQSEEIQIVADGHYNERAKNTSLTIYDNGEGQHPGDFESTFLSLLRGNKNEIPFVQGKYNMGGTGAIVFCGKKRYQLIASKKYTNDGNFGFTLIRKHPLSSKEAQIKKNTWYEYLVINQKIPNFSINELPLDLHNRSFKTGSIIKLYSYQLPSGSRSVISKDLNQSINEFLFQPALPILTVDKKERYPKDLNLQRDLFGLKRRLEKSKEKYLEDSFSIEGNVSGIGKMNISCYIFKTKIEGKSVKETRKAISKEFFKNNMSVLFSMNGQVHGHYTSEFISRLEMSLLKQYLLIHVDCTEMNMEFRSELFMASRDRLKKGDESKRLREELKKILRNSELKALYNKRKQGITLDNKNSGDLLKNFTKSLPKNSELFNLLGKTFLLEASEPKKQQTKPKSKSAKSGKKEETFIPKRYPTAFKLNTKEGKDGIPLVKLPLGGDKTIQFSTDVENHYFDRVEDAGDMTIALVGQDYETNETEGGDGEDGKTKIEKLINVRRSSPNKGTIKVVLEPNENVQVGDKIQVRASLGGAGNEEFEQIFWVQIIEKLPEQKKKKEQEEISPEKMGLPDYKLVYKEEKENNITWDKLSEGTGISMDYETVMYPFAEGDKLECIYINMDSRVIKNYKSKFKNISTEQIDLAHKRYITSVYFHTLFLYTINQNRKYTFNKTEGDKSVDVDLTSYLKDLFQSYYSEFLLNFGVEDLMSSLEE